MLRILNERLLNAGDVSMNLNSSALSLQDALGYAIQCEFSGSPNGTLKLQGSNDAPPNASFGYSSFAPTNWTDISGTSQSISASGSIIFNAQGVYYNWVRAVWASGGTGSLTIIGNTKGL